jgi:MFS family permease
VRASIPRPTRKLAPSEWGIALGLLVALFAAFVLVQLTVLFGGRRHVLETAGVTYAEYAREGFWQLLAAAGLTLLVVGAAVLFAATPERKHRIALRLLLGALCALTIVVLASALNRLLLYEDAFGLTRSRLFAEAVAVWLGGLFALLVAAGLVRAVGANLARIVVVGTALGLLAFSFASPDELVAERNVDRWRETGRIDLFYLQELSADAAPALAELPPHLRVEALRTLATRLEEREPWSSFNASRDRARELLASLDD